MANSVLEHLIDPQVMADMIRGKLAKDITVTPFANIDTTLQGVPGSKITIPRYVFIGEASDVAEGASDTAVALTATSQEAQIKKAMKSVTLTDESLECAYGDPAGESVNQISQAISGKIDADCMTALLTASKVYAPASSKSISYTNIVNAIDLFEEEVNTDKVMFVHPYQVTTLRKDANFISADKYGVGTNVIMRGEIGSICNARIVPSKRVTKSDSVAGSRTVTIASTVVTGDKFTIGSYTFTVASTQTVTAVAAGLVALIGADTNCPYSASNSSGVITLTEKTGHYGVGLRTAPDVSTTSSAGTITLGGTYSGVAVFNNPIVKVSLDPQSDADIAALSIYMKRDINIETERHVLSRTTDISADAMYVAALTDDSKVVIAKLSE